MNMDFFAKNCSSRLAIIATVAVLCLDVARAEEKPTGGISSEQPNSWLLRSNNLADFELLPERVEPWSGEVSAALSSKTAEPSSYATLAQPIQAKSFKGRSANLTAWVRNQDVVNWAGLWLRADRADGAVIAFQNMEDRPIRGNNGWSQISLTMIVPLDADVLVYGAILNGSGKIWFDEVSIGAGGEDPTAVAGKPPIRKSKLPIPEDLVMSSPLNLGFEKWSPVSPQ